jgi:hypothetical protein
MPRRGKQLQNLTEPKSTCSNLDDGDETQWHCVQLDSLWPNWAVSDSSDSERSSQKDGEDLNEDWDGLEDDEAHGNLLALAVANGDDLTDEDWVPEAVRRKQVKRSIEKAHPKQYAKGPDIGSKSKCTRCRYCKLLHGQTTLNGFVIHKEHVNHSSKQVINLDDIQIHQESITPPPLSFEGPAPLSEKQGQSSDLGEIQDQDNACDEAEDRHAMDVDEPESWVDVITEMVQPRTDIRGWDVLREQIKSDLTKRHLQMSLKDINQLMILRNFATLKLKGWNWISASREIAAQWHEKKIGSSEYFAHQICALAHHYQMFEQLPIEIRGGSRNAHSLLKDETVRVAA